MNIGIVGLGLIGGSWARAIKENMRELRVLGWNRSEDVIKKALLLGAIDEQLTEDKIESCDMLIIALYPKDAVEWVEARKSRIKKGAIVIDSSGVKRFVCERLFPLARENGFIFMGGHPMAGKAHGGFNHSSKALFQGASMILVPEKGSRIEDVQRVKLFLVQLGFTNVEITTAEEHDRMIAFTSQLAHIVSSAYIKSPMALAHKGFSAGSYKDMTRVAKLNENMWTELFLENADFIADEVDGIAERLKEYSAAVRRGETEELRRLLREGREAKMLIDGERF